MKKYMLLALLLCSGIIDVMAQNNFIGVWNAEESTLCIEIYKQKSTYYAKVKRCDNKEIIGKEVLIQMVQKSDTKLYGGTYYDDELKEEYEAKLILVDKDTIRLKVFKGLFNKVILWHRVAKTP